MFRSARRTTRPRRARRMAIATIAVVATLSTAASVYAESPTAPDDAAIAAPPAATGQFHNPINKGADPTIVVHKKVYYLATTQGDRISIWKSRSLGDLYVSPRKDVWTDANNNRNKQIWAPALKRFNTADGYRWYLYYTASDGNIDNHRMYVLESTGDDPMGPYRFKAKIADFGQFAIDGEPVVINGKRYFVWSGPGRGRGGPAQIYIAPMTNPWTTQTNRTAIPVDGGCPEVREGPTPLRGNGKTFLTYSACDTQKPDYQLWMTSIADGANPMNPDAWKQHPNPIFHRNDAAGVWGPGHHSFFTSPDGTEDWIVYHAKNTADFTYSYRTSRAQKISWNANGTPNLGKPLALGIAQDLPSGDPGLGSRAINDVDTGTGNFTVRYTGSWNSSNGCGTRCFRGNDHWTQEKGATATFTFTGTRIALFSVRDIGNGYATISIDGGPESAPIDFYGPTRVGQQPNYLSPKLEPGKHTIRITVTGERRPGCCAAMVSIDRAQVWP